MDYRKALSLMLASRYAEEGVEELASKGLIWGTYHLSIGQEACHIGVSMALEDGDIVVPTHRCHGYNIGQGSSLCSFFSEMLGSRHGLCGGLGGSMHMTDMAHGNFGSSAVVGSGISIAGGIALSFARRGLDNIAVAVLGDGAASRGTVHEMMNIASIWNLPVLFVLENNHYGMSAAASRMISTDAIYERAAGYSIRSSRIDGNDILQVYSTIRDVREYIVESHHPYFIELETYRMCGHSRSDRNVYRSEAEEMEWKAKDPIRRFIGYLEDNSIMSADEISHISESVQMDVRKAMAEAVAASGDTLSYDELEALSAPSLPDIPEMMPSLHAGTYRKAIYEALDEILAENSKSFLMGEDIGVYGGCFGVTGDLYLRHPGQVLETPVAEEAFTGMAVGAAAMGELPIVELMYGDFSTLASDALINHAAKLRFMSFGQLSCHMILRAPMGGGTGHGAQHTQSLENMFRVPGLIVVAPSDALSAKALLKSAAKASDPVVFIEHKALYNEEGPIGDSGFSLPLGRAIVSGHGDSLLVVSYSHAFALARRALAGYSDKITFIDLATINPLDEETIRREFSRIGKMLVVQDTQLVCSVAESVIRIASETGLPVKARVVSAASMPLPVSRKLENMVLPDAAKIAEAAFSLGL